MASAESPYRASPFLKWKGLRRWSRDSPILSKLFSKSKTKPCELAIPKLLRLPGRNTSSTSSSSLSSAQVRPPFPPPSAPAPLPSLLPPPSHAARLSIQRSTSFSHNSTSSVLAVGAIAIANCLRRHSDAIAPSGLRLNPQRFSLDSAHPYYTPTYLANEEVVPNMDRLGSSKANTRNSLTNSNLDILSIMGSPLVSKVKETCAQLGQVAARHSSGHHPLDLFVGNQFLTRVNPAPVSSILPNGDHLVSPSAGLLNASIKARDGELKDRIVFFL